MVALFTAPTLVQNIICMYTPNIYTFNVKPSTTFISRVLKISVGHLPKGLSGVKGLTWRCCTSVAGPSGTPRPVRRRSRRRGGRAEAERSEPAGDRHVERGGRCSGLPEHGPGASAAGAPGAAPLRHGSPPTRLPQLVTVGRWWLRVRPVVDQRAERLECSDWQVEVEHVTWLIDFIRRVLDEH